MLMLNWNGNSYELGSSPFVLIWKDAHCSQYPIDNGVDSLQSDKQCITLSVCPHDRSVRAQDGEIIAQLPITFCNEVTQSLLPPPPLQHSPRSWLPWVVVTIE